MFKPWIIVDALYHAAIIDVLHFDDLTKIPSSFLLVPDRSVAIHFSQCSIQFAFCVQQCVVSRDRFQTTGECFTSFFGRKTFDFDEFAVLEVLTL
jgi:hypothetical protein